MILYLGIKKRTIHYVIHSNFCIFPLKKNQILYSGRLLIPEFYLYLHFGIQHSCISNIHKHRRAINKFRHIINLLLWFLLLSVTLLLILLHTPTVQQRIGSKVSAAVSERLGTRVNIGKVDIGLLNRIILDDVEIFDQQGENMLTASRLSAKIDITPLLSGRISVSSAQIFGMKAHLYKNDADSPLNIQFALDSIAGNDESSKKPLNLNINSLVIRNGSLSYDRKDIPPTPDRLSPHHLRISNLSGHAMLYHLTDNSIDLKIKKISFHEASGLDLRSLSLNLKADNRQARVTDLSVVLPDSKLEADTLEATYTMEDGKLDTKSLQYQGNIGYLHLQPTDIAFAIPSLRNINETLTASARFSGTANSISVSNLSLNTESTISLAMNGSVEGFDGHPQWVFHIGNMQVQAPRLQHFADNIGLNVQIPQQLKNLGTIGYKGDIGGTSTSYALMGNLTSDAGAVELAATLEGKHFSGHVDTDGMNLGTITGSSQLGIIETTIEVEGDLPISRQMNLYAKGIVSRFDYSGHTYTNIALDGHYDNEQFEGMFGLDDANGKLAVEGHIDLNPSTPSANITASARSLNPEALGLTGDLPGHVFDFDLKADISGNSLNNLQGTADIDNLHIHSPGKDYHLNTLHIDADHTSPSKHLDLDTDFGHLSLNGVYDMEHLLESACNIVKDKLPNLTILPTTGTPTGSNFQIDADITKSEWISDLLDINLYLDSPLHLEGHVDENNMDIGMDCTTSMITIDDTRYKDVSITMSTENDTINTKVSLEKASEEEFEKGLELELISKAYNGLLYADISFDNNGGKQHLNGSLSTITSFFSDSEKRQAAQVSVTPSKIFVNGTPWDVLDSEISFRKNNLEIDGFTIENGDQYVRISGALTNDITDAINVDINKLNAEFLSNLLHVRGLDFGGRITGSAFVTSVFKTPTAKASLHVDGFTFEHGYMGDLDVEASWNAHDKRIDIDGKAIDGTSGVTDINGYVSLSPGEINLDIGANGTPLHFVEGFCSSFIRGIDARIYGNVRVFGPLKTVNIEGKVVSNGDVHLSSLNTTYTMRNDTVTVVPDHIIFSHDTIVDRDGNKGVLEGSINHHNLSNFTVDLDVKANKLLCYDFKQFGNSTFCGTVYATGNCHVNSIRGETVIDIDATPERNSVFWYNAASPDALSRQDFIKWNDATPEALDFSGLPSASEFTPRNIVRQQSSSEEVPELPSNLRINFNINATPNAALQLLMDEESGDYIALYGRGNLRATYFNMGSFNLFGNYVVDHGIYKLTIQNLMRKDFQFEQGGTIGFGGNPYEATLDLQAVHTVNGVPLSDLNLGRSFTANNIRVNCIMNITGTPMRPTVDFDLDMPTVSSDAEQMVRSIINSEEELNQQVIYLLAIGRFYNQNSDQMNESGQSQTSLAMQSLLSGTISQQINSLLRNVIPAGNWNFGANISTGDEGFNNAEYEGLLSGRLLDNRLQINGQFGYRDNPNATTSFIGDFDIQYLLKPNGNLAVKVYNQTNDRYFIKNSLNTQGVGLIMKKDFNGWRELIGIKRKKKKKEK